ncbi:lipopolysaccharide transport periplasmic protein LptA, partial [Thermodesulfobacteriota bacterium]
VVAEPPKEPAVDEEPSEESDEQPELLDEEDIDEQDDEEDLTDQEDEPAAPAENDAEEAEEIPEDDFEDELEAESAAARSQPKDAKKSDRAFFTSDKPININADSMEYDNKKNKALFTGNVVARQGNIVMFANQMKVFYTEKGGLRRVYALGNVKVIQGERIATGQKIVFYNDEQKIVATGSPRIWQGDNVVHGNKITIFLKEDRSVVEGGPARRASATIYPKQKKK